MFKLPFLGNSENHKIIKSIKKIKSGDNLHRDSFISDYRPFIIKTASNIIGNYVDPYNSEEYSVALMAFNEAIDRYEPAAKRNFLGFAQMVIKSRIIDYMRKNKKDSSVIPFSYFQERNKNQDYGGTLEGSDFEESFLISDSFRQYENIESKDDIELFIKTIEQFGFSVMDLADTAPKHKDSKMLLVRVAKIISERDELFFDMIRKKSIPRNELARLANVHIRTIEKNRKFIIGAAIIMRSNLNVLKDHLRILERGSKQDVK
ncbi:MAG: sigma-70 family RNA polymerase sigma factor [Clostridia bacterium]|nr:sigma-70 family RNA polymerase sigma factor [Clostridia bacterium]